MIPFYEIKKQLSNDPEILDHFIITEQNVIKEIRERAEFCTTEITRINALLAALPSK